MNDKLDNIKIGNFYTSNYIKNTGLISSPSWSELYDLIQRNDKTSQDAGVINDGVQDTSIVYEVVLSSNSLSLTSDFRLRISQGFLPGGIVVDKFGSCSNMPVDGGTIWEGADPAFVGTQDYTYTANGGALYYVSSTDAGDTQEIEFYTLTEDSNGNWNREVFSQNIASQTKTQLLPPSGDPIVRITRAINIDTTPLAGVMYVYEDDTVVAGLPQTDAKVRLIINDGNNQTLMALDTIPTGYVGFLFRGEAGLEYSAGPVATESARIEYRSRRFGRVFTVKKRITLITTGQSNYADVRSFPDVIPAKTDFCIHAESLTTPKGLFGTFDVLLVPEENFSDDYLNSIGQIKRV